jgi:hypothetical protein
VNHALRLHPDVAVLHAQIEALRDELARAVAYHDELRLTAIPYLEAVYQQALGPAHLAALHAQVEAQRAKRLVELAMQMVNRGQPAPPMVGLAGQVEAELAAWRQHIAAMAAGVQQATRALAQTLNADDTAALKRLYRDLARRLHPDANPTQGEREQALWQRVQEAYRDGDLARLRVLAETVAAASPLPTGTDAIDALRVQRQRLQDGILALGAASIALEQRPPLSQRSQLADPTWIAARISEFQAQAEAWREASAHWQAKLAALYPIHPADPSWN